MFSRKLRAPRPFAFFETCLAAPRSNNANLWNRFRASPTTLTRDSARRTDDSYSTLDLRSRMFGLKSEKFDLRILLGASKAADQLMHRKSLLGGNRSCYCAIQIPRLPTKRRKRSTCRGKEFSQMTSLLRFHSRSGPSCSWCAQIIPSSRTYVLL